jgi:hypothetical protein
MKKALVSTIFAIALTAPALGSDLRMMTKAPPPPPPAPWDIAFGASLTTDYIFRGITQTNHKAGVSGYFEPRFNVHPNWQLYAGIGGSSISFTNRAAAEIDFYGGIRPTFGPLALDLGVIYYDYPGGECYNGAPGSAADCIANGFIPVNGNIAKADASFLEWYAKATYTFNDYFSLGANFYASDDFLNTGADAQYLSGTAKYIFPALPNGVGAYVSGELGRQWLGTTDSFFGIAGTVYANGVPLADYATWNVGVGFTWKVFTLDLRYFDTDLSKADCNLNTGDFTATFSPSYITATNPGGFGSNWCSGRFVARLSADLTLDSLK